MQKFRKMNRYLLPSLLFVFASLGFSLYSQTEFNPLEFETRGKTFSFGLMENGAASGDVHVFLDFSAYQAPADVTVSGPSGYSVDIRVPAFSSARLELDPALYTSMVTTGSGSAQNKAFYINSNQTIAAVLTHAKGLSSDASLLYPDNCLGAEYLASCLNPSGSGLSEVMIVAVEDGTLVNIALPSGVSADNFSGSSVTLNRGQVFQLQSSGDLSGTVLTSDCGSKFAVFSGNTLANISGAQAHQFVQIPIYENLSTRFIAPKTSNSAETYKIVATQNSTEVEVYALDESKIYTDNNNKCSVDMGMLEDTKIIHSVTLDRGQSFEFSTDKAVFVKSDDSPASEKMDSDFMYQYFLFVFQNNNDFNNIYRNYYSKPAHSNSTPIVLTKTSKAISGNSAFTSVVPPLRQLSNLALCNLKEKPVDRDYYLTIATNEIENVKINQGRLSDYLSNEVAGMGSVAPYWINDRFYEFKTFKIPAGQKYLISHENGFVAWCYSVDPSTGDVVGEVPMHRNFPMSVYHEVRYSENTLPSEYVSIAEFLSRFTFCIKADELLMKMRTSEPTSWEFVFGANTESLGGGYEVNRSIKRSANEDLQISFDPSPYGTCPFVQEGERGRYFMDKSWSDFEFNVADYEVCLGQDIMLDGFYGGIMYDQVWSVYAPGSTTDEADKYLDDKYSVSPIFNSNVAGTFRIELTISDPGEDGCTYNADGDYAGSVTVDGGGDIEISYTQKNYCVGEFVNMSVTGDGLHNWSVSPSDNAKITSTDQSTFSFEVLGPLTVYYESENSAGCPVIESVDLTGNVLDTPSVVIPSTELCSGLSILMQPEITTSASGLVYSWEGGLVDAGYLSAIEERSPEVVLPFEADGSFDVHLTVTDGDLCVGRAKGVVSAKAKPDVKVAAVENDGGLSYDTYSAFTGEYVDLTSEITYVSGHDYSLLWFTEYDTDIYTGTTEENAKTNAVSVDDEAILKVTDETSGCYNYDTVKIVVDGAPLQISSIAMPNHYCDYDATVLEPVVVGGSGEYNYEWATLPAGLLTAEQETSLNLNLDLEPGEYSFTFMVSDANSPETQSRHILNFNVYSLPSASVSSDATDNEVCQDQVIALDGNAVKGDGDIVSHLWSSSVSGYLSSANNEAVDFIPSPAGASRLSPGTFDFTYKVTDEYGCYATSDIAVTVLELPVVTFSAIDQAICTNSGLLTLEGETVTDPNGQGTGVYSHAQVTDGQFDTDVEAGNYSVIYTYTDAKGCVNESKTKNVIIWGRPTVELDESYSAFHGEKVQLNGDLVSVTAFGSTPVASYDWTPVDSVFNASSKFTQTTSRYGDEEFELVATDNNGCTGTDKILITIGTSGLNAEIDVDDTDKVLCNGETAGLDVIVSGGSGSYNYEWTAQPADASLINNTSSSISVSPQVTTVYTVVVSDASELSDESISLDFEVKVNQNPTVDITSDIYENLCQTHQISLFGNALHGSGTSFTHKWTSSVANVLDDYTVENPVVTGKSAQTYVLNYTATDDNGCSATDDTTIVTNAMPRDVAFATIGNFCVSAEKIELTTGSSTDTDGTGVYSGSGVLSGEFNPEVAGVGEHTLKYLYTTPKGCQDSAFIDVEVYELPVLTFSELSPVCFDAPEVSLVAASSHEGVGRFKNVAGSGVSGSDFNPSLAGVGVHQLRYTFTDNNGCVDSIDQSIEVWELPVVDAGADKSITFGASPQLSPTVSNGTAPYTYEWSPGTFLSSTTVQNPTASSVSVTTQYEITVTDDNGCKDVDDINIFITSGELTVSIDSDDSDICKYNSTELEVLPSGGSGNYSVVWVADDKKIGSDFKLTVSPEETTTYTVTVSDGDNAPVSETFVVTVYELPTVDPLLLDSVCQQTTGKLFLGNATAGTNPISKHIWKGDTDILLATDVESPEVNTLIAPKDAVSSYDLRYIVVDEHACSDTADVVLRIDPNPVVNFEEQTFNTCVANAKEINGFPSGGSGVWASFEWIESSRYNLSATDIVNPEFTSSEIGAKRVSFTVTDTKGCSATDDIIVITYSNPVVNLEDNRTTGCVADEIILDGQPSGGNAPYIHLWHDPSGALLSVDADTAVVNTVGNGLYSFEYIVEDAYGCKDSAETNLRVYTNPVASLSSSYYSVCENTDLQLQGSIGAGADSYEYEWIGDQSLISASDITSPVFQAGKFGLYEFEYVVKSNYDNLQICYDTARAQVHVNENPRPDLGDDTETCADVDVVLALNSEGGDVASYQMIWKNGEDELLVSDPYNVPFTKSEDGVYEVVVRVEDDSTCFGFDTINVEVFKNPVIAPVVDSICAGSDLVIDGNPQFGSSQEWTQHIWTGADSNKLIAETETAEPVFNSTRLGEHILNYQVIDGNGCTDNNKVTVQVNDNPQPLISEEDTLEVCELGDLQLNVSVRGFYGGSISNDLQYNWSGTHSQYLNDKTSASPVFNFSEAGNYTLYVEVTEADGENCSGIDSIVVKVNPLPIPKINSPLEICAKDVLDLVGSVEYQLHNWTGLGVDLPIDNENIANPRLQTELAGEYPLRYTATTAKGCVDSIDTVAVVHALPEINAGGMIQTYNGDTVQLHAQPVGDEYVYEWAEADSLITSNTIADPKTKMILQTSLYFLTVTDTIHGCKDFDEVMVVDTTGGLNIRVSPEDAYICRRDSVELFALPGGGNPYGYSYLWEWQYGEKSYSSTDQIIWVKPSVTTDYVLTLFDETIGEDGLPRKVKDTVTVFVRQLPEFALQDQEVCIYSTLEVDGAPIPQSNTEIDSTSHRWFGSNLSAYDAQIVDFYIEKDGVYPLTYEVADTFGCVNSVTIDVTAHKLPEFEILSDEGICAGKGLQMSSKIINDVIPASDGYLWDAPVGVLNSRTVATPVLETANSGDYSIGLSITDTNGCTDSVRKTVKVYSLPETGLDSAAQVCAGVELPIEANPSGGSGGDFAHLWYENSDNFLNRLDTSAIKFKSAIDTKNDFTYNYVVRDGNNCTDTSQITVTVHPAVFANISPDDEEVCAESELAMKSNYSGGTSDFEFSWSKKGASFVSNDIANASFIHDSAATVTVYYGISDFYGCEAIDSTTVEVLSLPEPEIITEDQVCQLKSISLDAIVEKGNPDYSYSWSIAETMDNPGVIQDASSKNASYAAGAETEGFVPIRLDVEDVKGCKKNVTKQVNVKLVPKPYTSSSTITVYSGRGVIINRNPQNLPGRIYSWFGDNVELLDRTDTSYVVFNAPVNETSKDVSYVLNCTITDTLGGFECEFEDVVTVNVQSRPSPNTGTSSPYVCQGEEIKATIQITEGYWDLGDHLEKVDSVNLSGMSTITLKAKADTFGIYTVKYRTALDSFPIDLEWKKNPIVELGDTVKAYHRKVISVYPAVDSAANIDVYAWESFFGTEVFVDDSVKNITTNPLLQTDSLAIKVVDQYGCKAYDTLLVYVSDTITHFTWNDMETVCDGDSLIIVRPLEGGEGEFTYKWTDSENNVLSESDTLKILPTMEGESIHFSGSDGLAPSIEKDLFVKSHYQIKADFEYAPNDLLTILDDVTFTNTSFKTEDERYEYLSNYSFIWDPLGDSIDLYTGYDDEFVYGPYGAMDTYNARLIAIDNIHQCHDVVEKAVEVAADPNCFVAYPNTFRPNAALGENFSPVDFRGIVPDTYEIRIYNRWGQLLYQSQDLYEGWDGIYKNETAPQAVYVYQTSAQCQDGKEYLNNGDVTVLR